MDILSRIYSKRISDNERNLLFWKDYLNSLKSLDFGLFSDKLSVPVLVPIGSRILFKGELKHTSEVTVSLGADYFAKCSLTQAEILRQHRIKDAQSKLDIYEQEKEFLTNQTSFCNENIYENAGQEIVEVYSEEEDKQWRKKHKENIREYKIKSKTEEGNKEEKTDDELWNRLEELELEEELENELIMGSQRANINDKSQTFSQKDVLSPLQLEKVKSLDISDREPKEFQQKFVATPPAQMSKLDLLQKVIDRQNELEERLQELKHKDRGKTKTEMDLMSRLDEMEQLEELEDEMDRLDDIIEKEDDIDEHQVTESAALVTKCRVSFADEDDSETLEIRFKHSEVPPSAEPYDPSIGLQKPSDIYRAFKNSFSQNTSILKKGKQLSVPVTELTAYDKKQDLPQVTTMQTNEDEEENLNKTIIVRDVLERADPNGNIMESNQSRPTSLFKKKRMHRQS